MLKRLPEGFIFENSEHAGVDLIRILEIDDEGILIMNNKFRGDSRQCENTRDASYQRFNVRLAECL